MFVKNPKMLVKMFDDFLIFVKKIVHPPETKKR